MRIENSDVLSKNIRKILSKLESLCEYFDMDVNLHIGESGDSGYIDAFTEKSFASFEADINDDVLLISLYGNDDNDTIRWRIYPTHNCLDEFEDDYLDIKTEFQRLRSKGQL